MKPNPCPICGRKPSVFHSRNRSRVHVDCYEDVPTHALTVRASTEDAAIERWNRLTPPPAPPESFIPKERTASLSLRVRLVRALDAFRGF